MGHAQICVVAAIAACPAYLVYVYIYSSHKLLKTKVLNNDRLPSFVYLYMKYLAKALTRRTGYLYTVTNTKKCEVVYTVLNCRLETLLLRRFCSAAGYGWDYPDSEYRDIPLCFPEFMCRRLLLILLTDENFRLSPAGLVRVLEYRQIDAGVEVDICLSATSRSGCPVWESVLTFLSKKKLLKAVRSPPKDENESQPDEPVPENMKQVELRVPRTTGLRCVWSFSDYSLCRLLSLPVGLFGCRLQTAPSLWMLSVSLAEIEKHKGVGVITAPVNVTAQFKEPPLVPGKVAIKFWETTGQSPAQSLRFRMQQHGSNISHMTGWISR
ncbi:uncharacterized protein si:ch211-12e13.1 isoform X2 [Micropterus dolomieu]|uniref:uncharacterized protein si:ch211-12e13.1 isoform X2 n=1 Tax=Micropterus dolomieu TaxID=147949 RepID=UPI001E8E552A|nr:uncharacterized protein si:ch211-12e13.1 isoform X2 [Micropterus dolomieu]